MKYKTSTAALLFFGVLIATLFLQVAQSRSSSRSQIDGSDQIFPSAELELESVDQVQEINEHNFKNFEIHSGSEFE